jgi:hypothetical protein
MARLEGAITPQIVQAFLVPNHHLGDLVAVKYGYKGVDVDHLSYVRMAVGSSPARRLRLNVESMVMLII